jgi:dienelactone hydrolase
MEDGMWTMWVAAAMASGPHSVAFEDVSFVHPEQGAVQGRLYFPGTAGTPDLSAGPYPLIAFQHGWLGQTWMYDEICEEVASHGFAVASINTETGLTLDMEVFARDTIALMEHVEEGSADPSAWLGGLVDGGDWTALGHSMGGGTLGLLVGLEPRITTIVGFMPYLGEPGYYEAMSRYDGSALFLAGTDDTTSPTEMVEDWFYAADGADRALFFDIQEVGHQAVTDFSTEDGRMDPGLQLSLMKHLTTAFVLSEVRGEEDRWADLVGPGAPPMEADQRSASHQPVLWAELDGNRLQVGVAGPPTASIRIWAAHDPNLDDAIELASGELSDGLLWMDLDLPQNWTGNLYLGATVQGATETHTRTIGLRTDEEGEGAAEGSTQSEPTPGEEAEGSEQTVETDAEAATGGERGGLDPSGGCSSAPMTSSWWWLALGLLARRRATLSA